MDALLMALISGLCAEVGARTQNMSDALGQHYVQKRTIVSALVIIVVVSIVISTLGGLWVANTMNANASTLMMGLALTFAGFGQFRRIKPAPNFSGKNALPTSIIQLTAAHISDGTPFLAFAIAARTGNAALTGIGASLAVLFLCLPAILIPQEWHRPALFIRLRRIGAVILLVSGIWAILAALRLI
jgi:putative Ca2+/H+ antiporter (TMEM165/GDT1 family)